VEVQVKVKGRYKKLGHLAADAAERFLPCYWDLFVSMSKLVAWFNSLNAVE